MPRGRPKKEINKYCIFSNSCDNKYLCCNFCKNKKCSDRCHDDPKTCKYLCDTANRQINHMFSMKTSDSEKEKSIEQNKKSMENQLHPTVAADIPKRKRGRPKKQ